MGSKKFWSTVKFFLSSKGFIHNIDITIVIDNKIIENKSEVAQTFNSHYINIVKSTTGKDPTKLGTFRSSPSDVFLEKGVLKISSKFTGEHTCRSAISIKF